MTSVIEIGGMIIDNYLGIGGKHLIYLKYTVAECFRWVPTNIISELGEDVNTTSVADPGKGQG